MLSIMLDHPVTQKALAAVVGAGLVALGGLGWNTGVKVRDHDTEIRVLKEQQLELKMNTLTKLEHIGGDVGTIKTDVAVLRERTKILDAVAEKKLLSAVP
jgi:hypothetical protein